MVGGVQFGIFWVTGQICSATSRLVVHERIADRFFARLKQRAESIKICNPLDPSCRMGPVVSEGQHKKVLAFIQVSHHTLSVRQLQATGGTGWPVSRQTYLQTRLCGVQT